MNKTHTLKELADMFAYERRKALHNGQSIEGARMLALKHVRWSHYGIAGDIIAYRIIY